MPSGIEVRAAAADHFAWLRTRMAIERTMMAWIRTGVSLVGFGFTIVQFFDRMDTLPGARAAQFPDAPRYLGLMLIGCGVFALAAALWEYFFGIRYLWGEDFSVIAGVHNEPHQTPVLAVTIALILVGLFAFFSVFLRLL